MRLPWLYCMMMPVSFWFSDLKLLRKLGIARLSLMFMSNYVYVFIILEISFPSWTKLVVFLSVRLLPVRFLSVMFYFAVRYSSIYYSL